MDQEKEQKEVAEAGEPGLEASGGEEKDEVDSGVEAATEEGPFRTRWPDKMVQLPKMKGAAK